MQHYAASRALRLRQRIEQYRPPFVMFYSFSYLGWWQQVAGVELAPITIGGVKTFIGRNEHTVFAVVPQPAVRIKGKGKSYYAQVGRTVAELLRANRREQEPVIQERSQSRRMHVLVVGATGVLGRQVVPRLLERGHEVRAVVRDIGHVPFLQQMGVDLVIGDILDATSLHVAARGCDAVLHLATAIPRSGNRDWSLNDRIRREGTQNLIAAATNNGVRRYVQQSIVFMYGGSGEELVTEDAPVQPLNAVIESAADMEEMVRASALDWCILRGGHFYGPGTGREEEWRQSAREGNLVYPGDGSDFISLVHVVDMARAVVLATESAPARSIYNIVDDEPVKYKQLYTYITAQLGVGAPQGGGRRVLPSLRCSNARAKEELEWQPAYPSYRSGLS